MPAGAGGFLVVADILSDIANLECEDNDVVVAGRHWNPKFADAGCFAIRSSFVVLIDHMRLNRQNLKSRINNRKATSTGIDQSYEVSFSFNNDKLGPIEALLAFLRP